MSRINTNVQSLVAQRVLNNNNSQLETSLSRLSTGLKINSGKDDPAGLIASETLRSEKVALNAALTNITRANNVIATAEGGLVEVNALLLDLEDLVARSANEAGISQSEREANQVQIDSILDSIDRFANTTEFQGRRLLSGEFDYSSSGVSGGQLGDVRINSARVPNNGSRDVVVAVTASAQLGTLTYGASNTGSGAVTFEVAGNRGTEVISLGSATSTSAIVAAVNQSRDTTGVSAVDNGSNVVFNSIDFGSQEFVRVNVIDENDAGNFETSFGGSVEDFGRDATVQINGQNAITNGLTASVRSSTLSVDIDLTAAFGTQTAATSSFTVTGGGADFQLASTVNTAGKVSIGIGSVSSGNLGGAEGVLSSIRTGASNALNTENFEVAQEIVRAAQTEVSFLRGRLGAFQRNTLETTSNSLRVTLENTTAAESVIRDTDFAQQTAELTRSQILVQSGTNTLRLANQNPQNVLALLG